MLHRQILSFYNVGQFSVSAAFIWSDNSFILLRGNWVSDQTNYLQQAFILELNNKTKWNKNMSTFQLKL